MAFIYKSYSLKRCVLTVVSEGREAYYYQNVVPTALNTIFKIVLKFNVKRIKR